jgi:hypothetical protein
VMKRMTWFVGGVAAGVAGAGYAKRTVKKTADRLAPVNVARGAADRAKDTARSVADAVRDGRDAMRAKEAELRARRDGRIDTLDAHVGPMDTVLVDGRPVDTGRVIVLRGDRAS